MAAKSKTIAEQLNEILYFIDCDTNVTIEVEGKPVSPTIIDIQDKFNGLGRISPCNVCGTDTFTDIAVAWVILWDGKHSVGPFRLCDLCYVKAKFQARERGDGPLQPGEIVIIKGCLILRVRKSNRVLPVKQWRYATTFAPDGLFK